MTLGYKIYDDCGTMDILRAAVNLVNGPQGVEKCVIPGGVQAIVGHSGSMPTIGFARLIGQFQIPVVRMCVVDETAASESYSLMMATFK